MSSKGIYDICAKNPCVLGMAVKMCLFLNKWLRFVSPVRYFSTEFLWWCFRESLELFWDGCDDMFHVRDAILRRVLPLSAVEGFLLWDGWGEDGKITPLAVFSLFPETAKQVEGKMSACEIVRQINVLLFDEAQGMDVWRLKHSDDNR